MGEARRETMSGNCQERDLTSATSIASFAESHFSPTVWL
jgi:hypothetical protein